MSLQNKIKFILEYYNDYRDYLKRNHELFDIYEGNLRPYIQSILQRTLSPSYYQQIEPRIMPINILRRIVDKLAKVYSTSPVRVANSNQDTLDFYVNLLDINKNMGFADEFSHLFKGYALEPFVKKKSMNDIGVPSLRVLPYDRFFVISENLTDPLNPTIFVKLMGKVKSTLRSNQEVMTFFAYTDDEFIAFTEDGVILDQFMQDNEGINIYGQIPFLYGNRSNFSLMPIQDTDVLELSKLFPVLFTDLGGMILFSCYSIIYGIDVDMKNAVMAPNAFWDFKSDPQSAKEPKIGTIKPEADVEKVLGFIKTSFATWMETKNIRVGGMGNLTADNISGISKIIDEMDTYEAKKKSIQSFMSEEWDFWKLVSKMHNVWVEQRIVQGLPMLPQDWEVAVTFDDPRPSVDRKTEVETVSLEVEKGFLDQRSAVIQLYPDLSMEQVDQRLLEVLKDAQVKYGVQESSNENSMNGKNSMDDEEDDDSMDDEDGEDENGETTEDRAED